MAMTDPRKMSPDEAAWGDPKSSAAVQRITDILTVLHHIH
jgi:hypothetical protein